MIELSPQLTFLVEYLDLPTATGIPDAQWEVFQLEFLNNRSTLTIDRKSRQIGWSWTAAADAVATSCISPGTPNLFVSINLDEAREKVRYARAIIEALDADVRPGLRIDNQFELEIDNTSRLISHPCRQVRGKAKANVYLDEFAHYPHDRQIYGSALPVITRGGSIRIGSSPLGAGGMFWEIYDESLRSYPGYDRSMIPWWHIEPMCSNVEEAVKFAPHMSTEERVEVFGSERLLLIFENLPLEDFQQEYECAWVDESVAWISWDVIKRNQAEDADGNLWFRESSTLEGALAIIDELAEAFARGEIRGALVGGMDIGRRRNLSEIVLLSKGDGARTPYRLGISLAQAEFEDQESVIIKLLKKLPVVAFAIDETGIGMQLAENMRKRFPGKVHGESFTNPSKEIWSVDLKVKMEKRLVPIPLTRELAYQIHSIKKKITATKHSVFDTERNEKHHADKYWALALAVYASQIKLKEHKKPGVVKYV